MIDWEIDLELQTLVDTGESRLETVRKVGEPDAFELPDPDGGITTETPKTVAWYSETADYGGFEVPRDDNGHGSHVSGIMSETGLASVLDPDRTTVYEPDALLLPGDFVEYDVDAGAVRGSS